MSDHHFIAPKDLRVYARDFGAQCNDIAKAAIEATSSFK